MWIIVNKIALRTTKKKKKLALENREKMLILSGGYMRTEVRIHRGGGRSIQHSSFWFWAFLSSEAVIFSWKTCLCLGGWEKGTYSSRKRESNNWLEMKPTGSWWKVSWEQKPQTWTSWWGPGAGSTSWTTDHKHHVFFKEGTRESDGPPAETFLPPP